MASVMLFALSGHAEHYAVLVGVGEYGGFPRFHLDAPKEDVAAIRQAIIDRWRYSPDTIVTLVDGAASKANILRALDDTIARTVQGDQVFIYFSGHGTSALDPNNTKMGLPLNTGALVPSDVRLLPPTDMLKQLIVGSIDLKPRLAALDAKTSVFVVIDSCYSGATVKSLAGVLTPRDVPLSSLAQTGKFDAEDYDAMFTSVGRPTIDPDAFSFRHLVFLAAASQSEKAFEASASAIRLGLIQTVDGKPHGLLTDSLLRALRGDADEDHDGIVTYDELRKFAHVRVMNFGQTPQLLPRQAPDLTQQPVFGLRDIRVKNSTPELSPSRDVAVVLGLGCDLIRETLAGIAGITVVTGGPADFSVSRSRTAYELFVANGVRVGEFETPTAIVERIRREPDIRRIRDWRFAKQSFQVYAGINPSDRDGYAVGEAVVFELSARERSYFLLINVDVSGEITVAYKDAAGRPAAANQRVRVKACVSQPEGTEYMKLFAFRAPPPGWERLETSGHPLSPTKVRALLDVLQAAPADSGESGLLVYSSSRIRPGAGDCLAVKGVGKMSTPVEAFAEGRL